MFRLMAVLVPLLILAEPAQAKQVKPLERLMIDAGQPVRITGMDLDFAPGIVEELAESDAKAARKRADAGLPPLDRDSYPAGPQDGARYATMPFKQMFPLVIRDVAREWRLDNGLPVTLRITLDRLKTADAAVAILIASSSDILEGTVEVRDAASAMSLGRFRVEVRNGHGGWGGMLIRGGGIRKNWPRNSGWNSPAIFPVGRKSRDRGGARIG